MPESLLHLRLVHLVVEHIERIYSPSYPMALLHDLPGHLGDDKPPRIGGFVPDVYALDVPTSLVIVGEAKTNNDLETDHTRRQLSAFLKHLSRQARGVLIVGVPWQTAATARNLLSRLVQELGAEAVEVAVIDDVTG